jgi:hypothetical protein
LLPHGQVPRGRLHQSHVLLGQLDGDVIEKASQVDVRQLARVVRVNREFRANHYDRYCLS